MESSGIIGRDAPDLDLQAKSGREGGNDIGTHCQDKTAVDAHSAYLGSPLCKDKWAPRVQREGTVEWTRGSVEVTRSEVPEILLEQHDSSDISSCPASRNLTPALIRVSPKTLSA